MPSLLDKLYLPSSDSDGGDDRVPDVDSRSVSSDELALARTTFLTYFRCSFRGRTRSSASPESEPAMLSDLSRDWGRGPLRFRVLGGSTSTPSSSSLSSRSPLPTSGSILRCSVPTRRGRWIAIECSSDGTKVNDGRMSGNGGGRRSSGRTPMTSGFHCFGGGETRRGRAGAGAGAAWEAGSGCLRGRPTGRPVLVGARAGG